KCSPSYLRPCRRRLPQPPVEIGAHEIVIGQLRISSTDPIDLLELARREIFGWIETPSATHEPLTPQNLVKTGDTPGEAFAGVEEDGVRVGQGGRFRKNPGGALSACGAAGLDRLQRLYRTPGPHSPLPEEPAPEDQRPAAQPEIGEQVGDDVVVIAGV